MALSRRDCRAALLSEEGSPAQGCFALRTALRVDSATQLHIGRNDAFTTCSGHIPIPARWYATTPRTVFKPNLRPMPQNHASRLPAKAGMRLTPSGTRKQGPQQHILRHRPPAAHCRPPASPRRRVQGVYTGCSPGAHGKIPCTPGEHPVYTPCTRRLGLAREGRLSQVFRLMEALPAGVGAPPGAAGCLEVTVTDYFSGRVRRDSGAVPMLTVVYNGPVLRGRLWSVEPLTWE